MIREKKELTKEKVEVYGLMGDVIVKFGLVIILTILFLGVLGIIVYSVIKDKCGQVWWLSIVNATLGFGLRAMFKHYFKTN
ncbi:hypothetical protein BWD42_04295 [Sphingobacterium sp. CZ-UAM]|uniref:hypothetical protein n=1 Tax=Sphingobacterium sp. CZ-UAM TaxID=1933868 RepID=UPI0009847131|nr:hypothetical protein [Sphingobacterium sp. CZ-UAM]OOG19175.1 hypothetical protein BWD42_04295 [Sphingobacterium sp. CZ-UAM]